MYGFLNDPRLHLALIAIAIAFGWMTTQNPNVDEIINRLFVVGWNNTSPSIDAEYFTPNEFSVIPD
jgi:hypothetical protein